MRARESVNRSELPRSFALLHSAISKSPESHTRPLASVIPPVDNDAAVYQHVVDPLRVLLRICEGGLIADAIRIEHDNVSPVSLPE